MRVAKNRGRDEANAKYVYDGGHVCVGCGKERSINRRSLDDDRDAERVNSGLIGVVAILGIS